MTNTIQVEGKTYELATERKIETSNYKGYPMRTAFLPPRAGRKGTNWRYRLAYAVNLPGFENTWYWTCKAAQDAYKASEGSK